MVKMKAQYLIMGVGGGIALYLYLNKPEGDTKDWNDGWKAGWLTPGPSSILLVTGLIAYNS